MNVSVYFLSAFFKAYIFNTVETTLHMYIVTYFFKSFEHKSYHFLHKFNFNICFSGCIIFYFYE